MVPDLGLLRLLEHAAEKFAPLSREAAHGIVVYSMDQLKTETPWRW
jgi:hypothetical protein